MSLAQANAFYQALDRDPVLYSKYLSHCCSSTESNLAWAQAVPEPVMPDEATCESLDSVTRDRHWDETEILSFALQQGYCFSLGDLYQVWFGQHDYRTSYMERVGGRMGAIASLNRQLV